MGESLKGGVLILGALVVFLFAVVFFRITGTVIDIPTVIENNGTNTTVYCQTVNESGSYVLTQDVAGENYSLTPCFNITASNVEIDCQGHSIINATAGQAAVYAADANNITIRNCVIRTSGSIGEGISFARVNNSSILGNNLSMSSRGIYILSGENVIIQNNILNENGAGIAIEGGRSNRLEGNTLKSNSLGVLLNSSANNTLVNNSLESNNIAVNLQNADGNQIYNSSLRLCTSLTEGCISFAGSSNNLVQYANISSSGAALYIVGAGASSSNNLFKDSLLNSQSLTEVNVASLGNLNNSFLNVSYNTGKESVNSGSEVTRNWYYRVFVNSTTRNNGIANVNVSIYNSSNSVVLSTLTNSNGYTSLIALKSYLNNGSRNYLGSYVVVASNVSSSSSHSVNITDNLLIDYLSFNITSSSSASNSSSSNSSSSNNSSSQQSNTVDQQTTNTENQVTQTTTRADEVIVPPAAILYLSQSDIEGGYEAEIKVGDIVNFNISDKIHSLVINSFDKNPQNYSISVTISSEPLKFNLAFEEQKKIDFESDGYYDVLIGFQNVSFDEKPIVLISKINESVVKDAAPSDGVSTTSDTGSVNFGFLGSIEKKVNSPIIGPITPMHLIIGLIVISIIILGYVFLAGKGRSRLKNFGKGLKKRR